MYSGDFGSDGSDVFTIIREETNAVYKLPYVGKRTNALLIVMVSRAFLYGEILTDVIEYKETAAQNRSSLFSQFRLRFDYVCLH